MGFPETLLTLLQIALELSPSLSTLITTTLVGLNLLDVLDKVTPYLPIFSFFV